MNNKALWMYSVRYQLSMPSQTLPRTVVVQCQVLSVSFPDQVAYTVLWIWEWDHLIHSSMSSAANLESSKQSYTAWQYAVYCNFVATSTQGWLNEPWMLSTIAWCNWLSMPPADRRTNEYEIERKWWSDICSISSELLCSWESSHKQVCS